MTQKNIPMDEHDGELVEVLHYRYQAYLNLLHFLSENTQMDEQTRKVFDDKWDEAVNIYHVLERTKQMVGNKYMPEGQWDNYTFNFLLQQVEYVKND